MKRLRFIAIATSILLVLLTMMVRPLITPKAGAMQKKEPPHQLEGRKKLVDVLAAESLKQTFENLPNFDDTVWVGGTVGGDIIIMESYIYQSTFIQRLNRIRKILQATPVECEPLIPLAKEKFKVWTENFVRNQAAGIKKAPDGSVISIKPTDPVHSALVYAPATTYLLAEWRVYDALPMMEQTYSGKAHRPLSWLYLFYSMHLGTAHK